jgi:hypothetical protein
VPDKLAEVIAATSTAFTAECYRLYDAPPLGALVQAGEDAPVYAVVTNVATGPRDPGRRVLPRGAEEPSEETLYANHPQLKLVLATTFDGAIVGYATPQGPRQGLPPLPPRVHAFVAACSNEETAHFTRDFSFLRLLLQAQTPAVDEVIAACVRRAVAAQMAGANGASASASPSALVAAGRALARELAADSQRLSALLKELAA